MAQWNPLHDLVSLQDRMNRLFENASQRRASEAKPSDEVEGADWYPAADVCENDGAYTVAVDLPGIDRATLDISVDDNRLTIRGERGGQDASRHRGECPRGKFLRTFSVPASIKTIFGPTTRMVFCRFTFPNVPSEKRSESKSRFLKT